jgi:3'-5' exoribonuclease
MFKKSDEDFIENLNSRRQIRSQFVIADKMFKKAKTGRTYIDVTLTDKTGRIVGRMFPKEDVEGKYEAICIGNICRVLGKVNEYPSGSGRYNIIIDNFKELSEDEYEIDDFVITSDRDKANLIAEIDGTIAGMGNVYLKNLLKAFFSDKMFTDEFFNSPSAKFYHHNYMGGLLEHSVEVLKLCKTACEIFPELDNNLLYTGAILHDVGKLKAYDYDLVKIEFSEEGKLLDHIFISCDMVKEKMKEIEMPNDLSTQLLHLILSHHGEVKNGWGSPVDPKTPEAVALHQADNLDAKVKGLLQNL